jgi:tRNA pseudouridine55 synthase
VAPGANAIEVSCSAGTYVRTLAADLGEALGGGAHLRDLRRTAIGSFRVDDAVPIEALTPEDLRSPAEAMADLEAIAVTDEQAAQVAHGRKLTVDSLGARGPGPWAVLDGSGALLAVYERHRDGAAKPSVVLPAPPQT